MSRFRSLSKVFLSVVIVLCMVITNDPNVVNAIQQNSYSYLSQGLMRPDLISYNEAKTKGHISRMPEREDEYTFVFKNIDGTLTSYTYGTKVQWKDSNKNLQEIDLDIKTIKDKSGKITGYHQTGNGVETDFPATLRADTGIKLETADSFITMTPMRNGSQVAKQSNARTGKVKDYNGKVTYKDVFGDGAGIELYSTPTGIKEDIVLNKAPKSNVFEFKITAPGLTPTVTQTGAVEFYDPKTLALKYRIPEAYAKDSYKGESQEGDGHYTEDIKVTMTQAGEDVWIYRLELAEEFLFGKSTVYPVTIDPSMLQISGSSNQDDSYVNSANPSFNYDPNSFMCVGRDSTLLACRTYVKFDLSTLTSKDALAITAAEYRVYEHSGYTSNCDVRIYHVGNSWSSNTITWNSQINFNRDSITSQNVHGAGWYNFDVTTMVNSWYLNAKGGGGYANNGFAMISDQESSLRYRRFYSSESSIYIPYLIMDYSYVDRTAPNKPTGLTTDYIKDSTFNGKAKLKVSWTAATDLPNPGAAGIKNYKVVVKNSSGTTIEYNNNVSSTTYSYTTNQYYDDISTYTFYVRAVDNAKEVNDTAIYNESGDATATLYVPDCEKPTVYYTTLSPSSSITSPTNSNSLTLNWLVYEQSSLYKLEYWIASPYIFNTVYNPSTSGSTAVSVSALGSGSYTLYVRFTDIYSNVSSTFSNVFTIDRTLPIVTSNFTSNLVGDSFTLPMQFMDNYMLGEAVAEYGVGINPGTYTAIATKTLTDFYDTWSPEIDTTAWTADQYYTVRVRLKDKSGNWCNTFTKTVIKSGEAVTIPAALVVEDIPETITDTTMQIVHNRQSQMYSEVFINGTRDRYFSANTAINILFNKPSLPDGETIDLVVRSNTINMAAAEYNVDRLQKTFIHDMNTTQGLTFTNTVIDETSGSLKLAVGYTTGSAILTIPITDVGSRIDAIKLEAVATIPAGSNIGYYVYNPITSTWNYTFSGAWIHFSDFIDFSKYEAGMQIKIELYGSSTLQLSALKVLYNDLNMAPARRIKLLPDVTGLKASNSDTSNIKLNWDACPQVNGLNPVYNVYRTTDPAFETVTTTQIATGIIATSLTDTMLQVNQTFYYKVIPSYSGLNFDGVLYSSRSGMTSIPAVNVTIPDLTGEYATSGRLPFRQDAGISIVGGDAFTDLKTGNLSYRTDDLNLPNWQFNMSVSKNYNSTVTQSSTMGKGWDLTLNQFLEETYTNDAPPVLYSVIYKDHQGTIWKFLSPVTTQGVTQFNAPIGCPYKLQKEGGLYTLKDGAGLLYKFNTALKLASVETETKPTLQEQKDATNSGVKSVTITDTFGKINYCYTAVKDINGNITGFTTTDTECPFSLAYVLGIYILSETAVPTNTYTFESNDPLKHDETLALLSNPATGMLLQPSELNFTYNGTDQLVTVSDRIGHRIDLTYNSQGMLEQISDMEGRKVIYEYYINGLLQKVKRLDHYTNLTPVYAETTYSYDANGYLTSISDSDAVTDNLLFDASGRLIQHSSLYSLTEDAEETQVRWRNSTLLDYGTGNTTIRKQMQRSERAPEDTDDTLTDTVRLDKIVYAFSSLTGLTAGNTVYGKPVLQTGEDGLEEEDYTYPILRTSGYTYSDTDDDNLVDQIIVTTEDTSTPAHQIKSKEHLSGADTAFSEGYWFEENNIVSHYDLSGRLEYNCHDFATHGTTGHVCERYTYTLAGRTLSQMTKFGLETTSQYDACGNIYRTVYPDAHVSISSRDFIYDPQNPGNAYFTSVETDYGMNYTRESRYDCLGQVIYEDIATAGEWLYLEYTYNDLGLNVTRTDTAGNVTTYVYDGNGRTLTETVDQVTGPNLVTTYTYNSDEETLTESDPYGNTVTYVYEPYFDKRLLSKTTVVNGETTVEEYNYLLDANGEYTLTTTYPDSTQTITKLQSGGRTSSISKAVSGLSNGTAMERTFMYSSGKLEGMGQNGFKYVFTYNEDEELSGIAVSDGISSQTIVTMESAEDTVGNQSNKTGYSNGQSVISTTDASGRIKKIEQAIGTATDTKYEYAYSSEDVSSNDLDGQELTTITDHVNGQTITHAKTADAYSFTRETTVKDTVTLAQLYAYTVLNTEDDIILTTEISGTTQSYFYGKDDSGRLGSTKYTLPNGGATTQKTDKFGVYGELVESKIQFCFPPIPPEEQGTTQLLMDHDYTYRTVSGTAFTGQVAQESLQFGSVSKAYNYTYDDNGNITKITRTIGGVTTDIFRYVYDEAGQIKREDNVPYGITFTWQYDKGGNVTSRKYHMLTAEGVTPGAPMLTQPYSYSIGPWKDQLTSYNLLGITYDNAGNPTNYMGKSLVWTMGRQLESYTSSGTITNYKYNDSGIRTQKKVGTVTTDYVLNGSQILAQTTNNVKTDFRYDGNGKLIAIRYNGTEYYYVTNILGDVTGLIDSTGNSVVEYTYDAWGRNLFTTGTLATTLGMANPFRYRGYYYDTETGLYYLQSRYYDPNTGRFINADDTFVLQMTQEELLGANLFAYCNNNPVMNSDPSGSLPGWLKWLSKLTDTAYGSSFDDVLSAYDKVEIIAIFYNNLKKNKDMHCTNVANMMYLYNKKMKYQNIPDYIIQLPQGINQTEYKA